MKARECFFDGMAGPSHNFAGLAFGNKASMRHGGHVSHPRKAALEGLAKMRLMHGRGFAQAALPPHERPATGFLKQLGFSGSEEKILKSAFALSPALLRACWSSSGMWAANSATVSYSSNTEDGKVHFSPANLCSNLHRSMEAGWTASLLKRIFPPGRFFTHHEALPSASALSDEGSANRLCLSQDYGSPGVEVFVYGKEPFSKAAAGKLAGGFPPRQSALASRLIARRHLLKPQKTVFAKQSDRAIQSGAFHNDVISASDRNLIFAHERAFAQGQQVIDEMERKLRPTPLIKVIVRESEVSLEDAVRSYLFNSELLPAKSGKWLLLSPKQCQTQDNVSAYLQRLTEEAVIEEAVFAPLSESMGNGGGPACLSLRMTLTEEERAASHSGVFLTEELFEKLEACVKKRFRERLQAKDLLDPLLIRESHEALDEISVILQLPKLYSFQRGV